MVWYRVVLDDRCIIPFCFQKAKGNSSSRWKLDRVLWLTMNDLIDLTSWISFLAFAGRSYLCIFFQVRSKIFRYIKEGSGGADRMIF